MTDAPVLVTGATGQVGGHVARSLIAAGVPVRLLVRDRSKAAALAAPDVDVVEGDYTRPDSLTAAFAGVERAFVVAPLVPDLDALEGSAFEAAARAGVQHVVKLSTAGVAHSGSGGSVPRQYPLHRRSEQHLEQLGLAFTHLRPGPFMQNTFNFAPSIVAEGAFYGSWGDGAMGYLDVRDLAEVAARVLTGDGHEGKAYELTGPQQLAPSDIAGALSVATGRDVRYVDVPAEGARQAMIGRGLPEWFAGAMVETMQHARHGGMGQVTDVVATITGHPPRSYDEFAREFAATFQPG